MMFYSSILMTKGIRTDPEKEDFYGRLFVIRMHHGLIIETITVALGVGHLGLASS